MQQQFYANSSIQQSGFISNSHDQQAARIWLGLYKLKQQL
jgi:hypothetical protein